MTRDKLSPLVMLPIILSLAYLGHWDAMLLTTGSLAFILWSHLVP